MIKKGKDEIKWTVVKESHQEEALEEITGIGLHGMDLHHLPQDTMLTQTLLNIMFPDVKQKLEKMNACIESSNMEEGRGDK